mmetsp:Transcript_33708/g.45365  ORF Transcript_33708/g.45365 Transcript_33708/m.45365 type:complete len:110 (-) Transcript_33708:62-391(-)
MVPFTGRTQPWARLCSHIACSTKIHIPVDLSVDVWMSIEVDVLVLVIALQQLLLQSKIERSLRSAMLFTAHKGAQTWAVMNDSQRSSLARVQRHEGLYACALARLYRVL